MSRPTEATKPGADGKPRCFWCVGDQEYERYHDEEWGVPVRDDDRRIFEKLSLEAMQSGLSWLTILRKRDNFRAAFANFDHEVVAQFGDDDFDRLMNDAGIVRNRLKIQSIINNAGCIPAIVADHGSLSDFVWSFAPEDHEQPSSLDALYDRSTSAESKALAKGLKSYGFRFIGPTTAYAAMQSLGLVNDHFVDCHFG